MTYDRAWAYDHFAEFVRALLRTRSASQVAFRSGVDKTTILRAARGRAPSLRTAKAVVDRYAGRPRAC